VKWFFLIAICTITLTIGIANSESNVEVEDNRQCDCLLLAGIQPATKSFGEWEWVGNIPRIAELENEWMPDHWPELIPDTCDEIGLCAWVVRLQGKACVRVKKLPHFIYGVWLY